MKFLQSILLILCWLANINPVSAQLYYNSRTLTTDDGLSNNNVKCFYKDKTGFLWIGTQNGLNRYDGHSFRIFRPTQYNSISNEVINTITGDAEGRVWVGTMGGLNYYEPSENKWYSIFPEGTGNKIDLPSNITWDLEFDSSGLLWIASDVFEFSSYNISTNTFTYYDWPAFSKTLLPASDGRYRTIQKFIFKSENECWLGTTCGLIRLDIRTKKFTFLGSGYSGNVADLSYDRNSGKVFLSTDNGKLFVYDENKKIYSEIIPKQEPYPSTSFPARDDDELWMAAEKGLLKISPDASTIYLSGHIPGLTGSLLPGGVKSVYKDKTGIRWVATTNGISLFDADAPSVFLPLLPVSNGTSDNTMGGVYFDPVSDRYFVCSLDPAVVFIIDANGGNIQPIKMGRDGKLFSACNAIKADNENNIWLLTDTEVYHFDRNNNTFIVFPMPNKGSDVGFRSFTQDEQGNYWFGTYRQGAYYYRAKEKRFVTLPFPFLQWSKKITDLESDTVRHCVWISAYGSDVIRYDLLTGKMEGFEEYPGLSQLNLADDIMTDRRGYTWMATWSGGIFRYNPGKSVKEAFARYDMRTGLKGNSFISICEDAKSNIWLLSSNGICAIDSSGKLIAELNKSHSFVFPSYTSDSRSPHTIYFDKKRNKLLTAVGGGLLFNAIGATARMRPFNIVITSIGVGNRDTIEEINSSEKIGQLPFKFNSLTFRFAGLYYGLPADINYEYKLNGYDKHWIRTNEHTAFYQNLPPGNYNFQVRARYANGFIAGTVSGFEFGVITPFWKSTWFILTIILLIIAGVSALIYSLLQKLKTEKLLNSFAASIYGQNTIEDIFWATAKNCVQKLGFADCVIYQYDEMRQLLLQKAAYGPKNPLEREIYNSIAIPFGKGIVGVAAKTGKVQRVGNTNLDNRYIVDDERRLSEISIPIFVENKIFGVIDSEHPKRNFYTRYHVRILKKIAFLCSERIARYMTGERMRGKIARDLHDEMGSTLTSIHIMCKMAMEGVENEVQVKNYLGKIKANSARILEGIGDMVWVIDPANDNFEKLMFRMKEFAAEILEPLKINYNFQQEGILQTVHLNLEQRKEIYMIFKEAITNAAKYSQTDELIITLAEKSGILSMEITDKGIGFEANQVFSGNGLMNMRTRAEQVGAELTITAKMGGGCRIHLQLAHPLIEV